MVDRSTNGTRDDCNPQLKIPSSNMGTNHTLPNAAPNLPTNKTPNVNWITNVFNLRGGQVPSEETHGDRRRPCMR